MTPVPFHPGQRWVSNTESELGLGIVVGVAHRRVRVDFPAAEEQRVYAVDNAPLSRVHFQAGEQVRAASGQMLEIESVIEANHCLIYSAINDNGEPVVIPEQDLDSAIQFSKPQDRLFSGQIDRNRAFQLRLETLEHIRIHQQSPVLGLLGPRVQLLPHQLYIAAEVAARHAPRVLLADEVGLGKTIEAGLILHQQRISGLASRILIVVPDSLLHQWLVEMLRRFNLKFTIIDEDHFRPDEPDENPFESTQLALCTLSLLSSNPEIHELAVQADWDLLVVDEAHHLHWSPQSVSHEYLCIEALAEQAAGVLLLTATPEQLGIESHFSRLRLLDPARYFDLEAFIAEEQRHERVNQAVEKLALAAETGSAPDTDSIAFLSEFLGEDVIAELTAAATSMDDNRYQAVIRDLLDRYGTGRVLFRNTRRIVSGFPERKLVPRELSAPDQWQSLSADAGLQDLFRPERLLGEGWLKEDPRVKWLGDFLGARTDQKVLVICSDGSTAVALEEHLRHSFGILAASFHEGLSLVARDRAAARFSEPEQGAQVLVCSEIGSEGRNFQFAHQLVLFDLPLTPDLLEQRIGRLDRIGQRETVLIHAPFYADSAQSVLLSFYHEGIDAIEHTCPAGQVLLERFAEPLQQCMRDPDDTRARERLLENTRAAADELNRRLQRGRDRLLELNSFNPQVADRILDDMVDSERRQTLSAYMERIFDYFGVELEHDSTNSLILKPGDHMRLHEFPALPEDGLTATFSRELALGREDIHFLTWEHPMVSGAMDRVLNGEFGNTAFCAIRLPPLKPGVLMVETVFVLSPIGPARLQLNRYLPLTAVRYLTDSRLSDLSEILGTAQINRLATRVKLHEARELVRHARAKITTILKHVEQRAQAAQQEQVEAAIERMRAQLGHEIQRLSALAEINPNIRQDEIEALRVLSQELENHLRASAIRLDAMRIVVVRE